MRKQQLYRHIESKLRGDVQWRATFLSTRLIDVDLIVGEEQLHYGIVPNVRCEE